MYCDDRVEDVGGDLRVVVPVAGVVAQAREDELGAPRPAGLARPPALALRGAPRRDGRRHRELQELPAGNHIKCRVSVEYHITQYDLEQGALEIQYIEEFFGEFPRKKTAAEIVAPARRAVAPDPARDGAAARRSGHGRAGVVQGGARDQAPETEPKLDRPGAPAAATTCSFDGRRVLYTWIGGTRRDWRGQGLFRALTEQQELWAIEQGFDEIVVKTKNKFYDMRGTLDHLRFEVVQIRAQRRRQRRIEGVPEQEAAARDDLHPPQQEDRRPDPGLTGE